MKKTILFTCLSLFALTSFGATINDQTPLNTQEDVDGLFPDFPIQIGVDIVISSISSDGLSGIALISGSNETVLFINPTGVNLYPGMHVVGQITICAVGTPTVTHKSNLPKTRVVVVLHD